MKAMDQKLENFVKAWSCPDGGSVRACECGMEFFNADGVWDWEDGDLDRLFALASQGKAVNLHWSVSTLSLDGGQYVIDCTCWHPRALKIMVWIDHNSRKIADYLKMEKQRLQQMAEATPIIE